MLVQVSPWSNIKTSVKKPSKGGGDQVLLTPFIRSFRKPGDGNSKRRRSSFGLSSSSGLSAPLEIIGVQNGNQIRLLEKARECPNHQFVTRPGGDRSFYPHPQGPGGHSASSKANASSLPPLPGILDVKHDCMIALQNSNQHLCVWDSNTCTGPDDPNAEKFKLESPALSVSLLASVKGRIYGSCQDGRLFSLAVSAKERSKSASNGRIQYFPSKMPADASYIGTVARAIPKNKRTSSANNKRRSSISAAPEPNAQFYQIYANDTSVIVIMHRVERKKDPQTGEFGYTSVATPAQYIPLFATRSHDDSAKPTLDRSSVRLLDDEIDATSNIFLAYNIAAASNSGKAQSPHVASICLDRAQLNSKPIQTPPGCQHVGMIHHCAVAALSSSNLSVCDLISGAILATASVGDTAMMHASSNVLMMRADPHTGNLVVLHEDQRSVHVAVATVTVTSEQSAFPTTAFSLADRLRSSLSIPQTLVQGRQETFHPSVQHDSLITSTDEALEVYQHIVSSALANSINDTISAKIEPTAQDIRVQLAEYNRQSSDALGVLNWSAVNGAVIMAKRSIAAAAAARDGEGSSKLVDISFGIIAELLKTKQVSARFCFNGRDESGVHEFQKLLEHRLGGSGGSNGRAMSNDGPANTTTLGIIFLMLENCADVSEFQMAIMLNTVCTRASANDNAAFVMSESTDRFSPEQTHLARKCVALSKLRTQQNDAIESEVVLMVIKTLVGMVASYSVCNSAMLHAAVAEIISDESVAVLLARLFVHTYSMPAMPELKDGWTRQCQIRSAATVGWVSAIGATAVSGDSNKSTELAAAMQRYVRMFITQSEAIIKLQDDVLICTELVDDEERRRLKYPRQKVITSRDNDEISGYTVEKLIF